VKKIIIGLLVVSSLLISAERTKKQSANDCIESLQNEVLGIIYSNSIKKEGSLEELTEKINKSFEKDCDVNVTETKEERKARLLAEEKNASEEYILILDTSKDGQDCVETLQNEIAKIVHTDSDKKGKDKKVRLIIKGDGNNCTTEPAKK